MLAAKMNLWDKIQIALFSGMVAMIGTMVGGLVTRHTELEKWRRSNLGPSSEQFLRFLAQAQLETTEIIHDSDLDEPHRGIKITRAYMPAIDQARIVRLFMRDNNKDRFEILVKEVYHLHAHVELDQSRLKQFESKIQEIQAIFENEMDNKANHSDTLFTRFVRE